jgi:hypothetical protein
VTGDITDLRAAVNAVRALANLYQPCPPYTFTDPDSSLHGLAVKGLHMQELRDKLKEARDVLAFPALTYFHANVNPATNGGLKFGCRC